LWGDFSRVNITTKVTSHDVSLIEEELAIELCVHGYHVHNNIYVAAVGEEQPREYEAKNMKDML